MQPHNSIFIAIALAALVAGTACEGAEQASQSTSAPSIDEVVSAWTEVGLDATRVVPADERALGAQNCRRGPISGVDVTICIYDDASAALAARQAGLVQIGETTGTALPAGQLLLVVADRTNADPHGKAINTIAKTFRTVAGG